MRASGNQVLAGRIRWTHTLAAACLLAGFLSAVVQTSGLQTSGKMRPAWRRLTMSWEASELR